MTGESRQHRLWACLPLGLISPSEILVRCWLSPPCPTSSHSPVCSSPRGLVSVPQTPTHGPASGPLHRLFPLPETLLPHITHAHSLSSPRPLLKHRHLSGPLLIPYLKLYPPLPPHSLFYFPPQHSSPSHRPRNSLSIWAVVLIQSVLSLIHISEPTRLS